MIRRDVHNRFRDQLRDWIVTVSNAKVNQPRMQSPPKFGNVGDTPMWLVSIEPDKANHDRRTFECPRCQDLTIVVVDISPEA